MVSHGKRTAAIILFTALIIILVNLAWWLYYARTEESFEYQLSHRLAAIAQLGGSGINADLTGLLVEGYLSAYDSTLEIIERIKASDSLSEVFVIDRYYKYLATTQVEADSIYYLAALNHEYIDSVFSDDQSDGEEYSGDMEFIGRRRLIVTPGYQVGDIILKSAYAPLFDTVGAVIAALGVEADVDYTEVLFDLRKNLYVSSAISIFGGLIFGFFFFLMQRKFNAAEKSLFLSQAQANLGRMVAVVSHEIKNPLMIIRASAERLQKSGTKEADFIVEETDRLNSIVTGYLDFASGKKILRKQKTDLKELLTQITQQFAPRLDRDNVKLIMGQCDDNSKVNADTVALRQILINLILNGAEAVKEKNGGEVLLGFSVSDKQVMITVTDNGEGIDRKNRSLIFEPFYTTKTTGSGLGLFYSRKLIREMDGDIFVESDKGGPTIFKIILPDAEKG